MPQAGQVNPADIALLVLEIRHESDLFPEDTDEAVTFTAGTPANTFGSWAEIAVDVTGETFSSKVATENGHISGLLVEDLDTKDKRYLLEIAYGDDKTSVLRHRFLSGEAKKLAAVQYMRVRAEDIPAGETVYYRMKCETAGATCEISLRYHTHS